MKGDFLRGASLTPWHGLWVSAGFFTYFLSGNRSLLGIGSAPGMVHYNYAFHMYLLLVILPIYNFNNFMYFLSGNLSLLGIGSAPGMVHYNYVYTYFICIFCLLFCQSIILTISRLFRVGIDHYLELDRRREWYFLLVILPF